MSALVVLAGQSNALGFGVTPAELPTYAQGPDPLTLILTPTGFQPMDPGVNTGTPANPYAWGPEVEYAHSFHTAHPDEVLYLVKSVKGSTGLAADPGQLDWSPESRGELFDATTSLVAKARALTGLPVTTILWDQGEQDAADAAKASTYGVHLADLFAHMRAAWGDFGTQIVVARISDTAGLAFADQVRAAQDASAWEGAAVVSTDGLEVQPDHLHLAGAGEIGLGDRLFGATEPEPAADPSPDFQSLFGRSFCPGSLFATWITL